ncbi:hypothetical protein T439DRAFT_327387 [Meredithblackwellia eburnea MCA 4105]
MLELKRSAASPLSGAPSSTRRRLTTHTPPLDDTAAVSLSSAARLTKWIDVIKRRSECSVEESQIGSAGRPSGSINKGKGRARAALAERGSEGTSTGQDGMQGILTDGEAQEEDGVVRLNRKEVVDLIQCMQDVLDSPSSIFIHANDILAALRLTTDESLRRARGLTPSHVTSAGPCTANMLPGDIIRLILDQVMLSMTDPHDPLTLFGAALNGRLRGWRDLKSLMLVCKNWHAVAEPLYRQELHITTREFQGIEKRLFKEPSRASLLTRLHIDVYGFEAMYGRSSDDSGFLLPDIISKVPNLHLLHLSADRVYHTRFRNPPDFEAFAGTHMPTVITTHLQLLRTLVYGVPCSFEDIQLFMSKLPDLVRLDVTGDISPVATATVVQRVPHTLRRLWLPNFSISVNHLSRMLAHGTRIQSLGFTYDIDQVDVAVAISDERKAARKKRLVALFERIGPHLKELFLASPYADLPESGARGRFGGGGNWGIPGFQIALALGPNLPAPVPAGAPAPVAANNPLNGNQQNGAAAVAAPNPPPPQAPPMLPGINITFGAQPNPPPVPAPAAPPAAPVTANLNPPGQAQGAPPAQAAPAGGPGGGGNNAGMGGGFPFLGFPFNLGGNNGNAEPEIPTTFFEEVLAHCSTLQHLEMYGRRYTSDLIGLMKHMPLQRIALSVPSDEEKPVVVQAMLAALQESAEGPWRELRSLELNGKGGDWDPQERRSIKQVCDRLRIAYSSLECRL